MTADKRDTEWKLVKQSLQGDHSAFELLYKSLSPKMYAVSLRYTHQDQDAQDVLQEAFIRIYKNLKQFKFSLSECRNYEANFWLNETYFEDMNFETLIVEHKNSQLLPIIEETLLIKNLKGLKFKEKIWTDQIDKDYYATDETFSMKLTVSCPGELVFIMDY